MRVIAGEARSLPLKTVPSDSIRPTTDKTKETLFNILAPRIPGCRFLDLFSGSGAIAIEALSRGAVYACLVENYRPAIRVITENLNFTKMQDKAEIIKEDVRLALPRLEGRKAFDIIFMDPPFEKGLEKEVLSILRGSRLLKEDGLIIIEASVHTDFSYLDEMGYELKRYKKYKKHAHLFITPKQL